MGGGLLNIIAIGNQNILFTGNPKKTFFKSTYSKYTNFGLQKFRIDYNGTKKIALSEPTNLVFKIPRHADLLMDTFLVINLPHIWSPIYFDKTNVLEPTPYEFKWIEHIGTQLIQEISITCGGETLQKVTGEYLTALVHRDFSNTKKDLYNRMTGNVPELYNPLYDNDVGEKHYPNAIYHPENQGGAQPSIMGRKLYIPINVWFTLSNKLAFPLIAMQYNELKINVTLRPVKEWFTIINTPNTLKFARIQPNFNLQEHQLYNFIQSPPINNKDKNTVYPELYINKRNDWKCDVHLISTYGFLSDEERRSFASIPHNYLIREAYQYTHHNLYNSRIIAMDALGMVASWMFFFRRTDANLRNEWSNYTNWEYNNKPQLLNKVPMGLVKANNPLYQSNVYNITNTKNILNSLGILLDGKYRENILDSGIYNYIEKYLRTSGNAPDGLYCYNFGINNSSFDLQPSGAINLSKFKRIEFELETITPPRAENTQVLEICDPITNEVVGINKQNWRLFTYTFDLYVFEERYNILKFEGGNCGLMYAR